MMKIAVYLLLACFDVCVIRAFVFGYQLKRSDGKRIYRHKNAARACLWFLLAMIAVIESHNILYGHARFDALFAVHMLLAVPCLVSLVLLNTTRNGIKSKTHLKWAIAFLITAIGINVTGIPLTWIRY